MPAYAGLGEVGAHGVDASEAGVEPAVAAYQLTIFGHLSSHVLVGSKLRRSLCQHSLSLFLSLPSQLGAFLGADLAGLRHVLPMLVKL